MPYNNILDSTAYSTLNPEQQKTVRNLFELYQAGRPLALEGMELFSQRKFLSTLSTYYNTQLDETNSDVFPFLNSQQRVVLEERLLYTFYIVSFEYQLVSNFQLEAEYSTRESLRKLGMKIRKCANLLQELRKIECSPEVLHQSVMDDSEKYLKYLGFDIAQQVIHKIDEITSGDKVSIPAWEGEATTVVIKSGIDEVSSGRSSWGLNSHLVLTVINLLPAQFSDTDRAAREITLPGHAMGYLGWIMSYTQLGMDLLLVAKHSINGPWMNDAEKKLPITAWQRFATQFEQRKFSVLNGFIGATISMACFFWLNGSELGNVMVIGALLANICLTTWRYIEESTNHNRDRLRYQSDIEELKRKLDELADEREEKAQLQLQLDELIKADAQCEFNWKYKTYRMVSDMAYKIGTIVAFSIMFYFFFPVAAVASTTQLILNLVGSVAYFSITVINSGVNGGLDIAKSQSSRQLANAECERMLNQFKEIQLKEIQSGEPTDSNGFIKKQLYLDMKRLMGDSDYQERMVSYQKVKLVHGLFLAALMPTLLFVSLMFMPMGVGLGVLAIGFALLNLSTKLLKEPSANVLPKFDDVAYEEFLKDPTLHHLKNELVVTHQAHMNRFIQDKVNDNHDDDDGMVEMPSHLV